MGRTKARLAKRTFGAGVTAVMLAGVLGGPAGAARPTTGGPEITNFGIDGNCRATMTYTAKGGKLGEVDLWARTWGYTSPTDTVGGYDIWAGSTWAPATMVRGSGDVAIQLAAGGRLKKLEYYGWLYTRDIGTYKDGTATPIYSAMSTCVIADHDYTVRFHDNYTPGDAGYIAAYQQRVRFGQLITEPAPLTRTGYVFLGWVGRDYGYLGRHPSTGVWDFITDTMLDYDPLVMYAEWAEIIPVP